MTILQMIGWGLLGLLALAFLVAMIEELVRWFARGRDGEEWRRQMARGLTSKRLDEWRADNRRRRRQL